MRTPEPRVPDARGIDPALVRRAEALVHGAATHPQDHDPAEAAAVVTSLLRLCSVFRERSRKDRAARYRVRRQAVEFMQGQKFDWWESTRGLRARLAGAEKELADARDTLAAATRVNGEVLALNTKLMSRIMELESREAGA